MKVSLSVYDEKATLVRQAGGTAGGCRGSLSSCFSGVLLCIDAFRGDKAPLDSARRDLLDAHYEYPQYDKLLMQTW